MHIQANIIGSSPEIIISHNQQQLYFSANVFTRKAFATLDVYDHINRYWASQTKEFNDRIFEIYKEVDRGFSEIFDTAERYQHLQKCIKQLFELHPLEVLELWLNNDKTITIPDSVKDAPPTEGDVINTAEKTYTRKEYMELISLSLFLRCITPIWGEYTSSIRKDTGVDRKEYETMQLLINTGILETPAMQKLNTYTYHLTKAMQNDKSKIINAFSSEDITFLHLALVCIRKVCIADISGLNKSTQIVATIFKFLSQRTNSADTTRIIVKEVNGGSDSGDKNSFLESYRKRFEISEGERMELVVCLEDPMRIVKYLHPEIDEAFVMESMQSAQALCYETVSELQLYMAGWLIKSYITPQAVWYVDKRILATLLGALEAVLWHRGHHYMALLISSHLISSEEEIVISGIGSREQIDESIQQELYKWFPYYWGYTRKGRDLGQVEKTDILTSIDAYVDRLTENSFRATASDKKLIQVFGQLNHKLPVYADAKTLFAKLLIDNEERISAMERLNANPW